MAGILRSIVQRPPGRLQTATKGVEPICTDWIRHKFTRSRIPDEVFRPSPEDHEKYGGDPQQPHKLHIVTRIKSTKRRPYWEKDIIKMLGLQKAHTPQVHKNIPSVNAKLKVVKHLIRFVICYSSSFLKRVTCNTNSVLSCHRIKPLKLPQGLPTEEDMSNTCLRSTGELVVRWLLSPADREAKKC
ncbi:unnamed protein product [Rangifer tarandus platyrhynchus]|uniref:Uncharacterized protein n=3 Tax=Rangifer tarandus platyrhynchus TaxID=3082113 RepID=A0ACB0F089_RANTA|nr:unnamed protein product [Rangifer tarandus platyrhynchus]CAI9706119.1 unnamed protein product [Rangifer tarandus platyrhynchus]